MTATVDPTANHMAPFVVMYDTPSKVDAFERHYNDVHIPLAKQLPGHVRSEIGQRTAEDARGNLARYATFRGNDPAARRCLMQP